MTTYSNWLQTEKDWINKYCKKELKRSILFVAPAVIIFMAVLTGVLPLIDGNTEMVLEGALAGVRIGLFISFLYIIVMYFSLKPNKYVWAIENTVASLSLSEEEKTILAQEVTTAVSHNKQLEFEMIGPKSNHTPAKFIKTEHFALLIGGTPYCILVRLSDIAESKASQEQKEIVTRSARMTVRKKVTLYTIGFYRKDRMECGLSPKDPPNEAMGFFSEEIRNKAFAMIQEESN